MTSARSSRAEAPRTPRSPRTSAGCPSCSMRADASPSLRGTTFTWTKDGTLRQVDEPIPALAETYGVDARQTALQPHARRRRAGVLRLRGPRPRRHARPERQRSARVRSRRRTSSTASTIRCASSGERRLPTTSWTSRGTCAGFARAAARASAGIATRPSGRRSKTRRASRSRSGGRGGGFRRSRAARTTCGRGSGARSWGCS